MTWVLILMLANGFPVEHSAVATAVFADRVACERAGNAATREWSNFLGITLDGMTNFGAGTFVCTPSRSG